MASERQRKRKSSQRRNAQRTNDGSALHDAIRRALPSGAPSALGLRKLWAAPQAVELFAAVHDQIVDGLPFVADGYGEPVDIVMDGPEAWDYLELMHDDMTTRIRELLVRRGSAEWLWWLRRLRGQFNDFNDMLSTGPYIQAVAESLAAGNSHPSQPAEHDTFTFELSDQVIYELAWLREIAIAIYQLHSAMKRGAKGQRVHFIPRAVPRWEPDDGLDDAIEEYDGRTETEAANLMAALGVAVSEADPSFGEGHLVGGLVPAWTFVEALPRPSFAQVDPIPARLQWIDLDAVEPLASQSVLTQEQVALITLLWACHLFATRDPKWVERRLTAPLQWGYSLIGADGALLPAIDDAVQLLACDPGRAIADAWCPSTGQEVLDVLAAIEPIVWPPLAGNPVHGAGKLCVVDLVGASRRLFATLTRPSDGAAVNLWSDHFEENVQAAIDATPWRPEGAWRDLIGRTIRRTDKTHLTNIDALGVRDGRVLLVSCKSIAFDVACLARRTRRHAEHRGEDPRRRRPVVSRRQRAPRRSATTSRSCELRGDRRLRRVPDRAVLHRRSVASNYLRRSPVPHVSSGVAREADRRRVMCASDRRGR